MLVVTCLIYFVLVYFKGFHQIAFNQVYEVLYEQVLVVIIIENHRLDYVARKDDVLLLVLIFYVALKVDLSQIAQVNLPATMALVTVT